MRGAAILDSGVYVGVADCIGVVARGALVAFVVLTLVRGVTLGMLNVTLVDPIVVSTLVLLNALLLLRVVILGALVLLRVMLLVLSAVVTVVLLNALAVVHAAFTLLLSLWYSPPRCLQSPSGRRCQCTGSPGGAAAFSELDSATIASELEGWCTQVSAMETPDRSTT